MGLKDKCTKRRVLGAGTQQRKCWFSRKVSPPVIPRYLQKFEITNENEDQRILRERSIINNYKREIEMEKLRIASCHDRVRRLDTEMEVIVFFQSALGE